MARLGSAELVLLGGELGRLALRRVELPAKAFERRVPRRDQAPSLAQRGSELLSLASRGLQLARQPLDLLPQRVAARRRASGVAVGLAPQFEQLVAQRGRLARVAEWLNLWK